MAYRITSNIAAMKVKFGMPVAYMVWAEQRAIETIGSTHISHSDMHMNTPDFSVVRKTSFLCLDRLELFPPSWISSTLTHVGNICIGQNILKCQHLGANIRKVRDTFVMKYAQLRHYPI